MTKPTGRPKGRPKVKEYVTLMARVPLELVEQARRYAARKRQPISEVLRDGLLLLLEQEDTAPHYVYDRNTPSANVSDTKEDTPRTLEAPQAPQPVKVSDVKEAMLPPGTHRPPIVSDTKEDNLPRETSPAKMSDTKSATLPSFDTSKFYLGKLCPHGHDFHGTGQSLLRKHNQRCRECENTSKRDKRARERPAAQKALTRRHP